MSTVTIIGEIALPVRFETRCRFVCCIVLYCLVASSSTHIPFGLFSLILRASRTRAVGAIHLVAYLSLCCIQRLMLHRGFFNDSIWGQRATMAFRVHSLYNFRRPCSLLSAYSPCASHSGVGKRDARAILFSAVSPGDAIYSRASSLRNILSQVILCAEEGCESREIGERACGQTILYLSLLSCR